MDDSDDSAWTTVTDDTTDDASAVSSDVNVGLTGVGQTSVDGALGIGASFEFIVVNVLPPFSNGRGKGTHDCIILLFVCHTTLQ